MLLPTSKALMNLDGLVRKLATIEPESDPRFLSTSTLNRLAETKAISIPEKKADNTRQTTIIM